MRKPSLEDLLVVIQGDSLFNEDMLKRALEEHKKDVERLGGKVKCSIKAYLINMIMNATLFAATTCFGHRLQQ